MSNDFGFRFEHAAGEQRRVGITLTSLHGDYQVNFRHAGDATARTVEPIDEALSIGWVMASERAAASPRSHRPATPETAA